MSARGTERLRQSDQVKHESVKCNRCANGVIKLGSGAKSTCPYCHGKVYIPTSQQTKDGGREQSPLPNRSDIATAILTQFFNKK